MTETPRNTSIAYIVPPPSGRGTRIAGRPARQANRGAIAFLLAAIAIAVVGGSLAGAGPAWAHATLQATDPAANASVASLPEVIRLTFSESLTVSPVVTVKDPDAAVVNSSPLSPRGNTVLQPVRQTKAGRYTVIWSGTANDGHKANGEFSFVVGALTAGSVPAPAPSGALSPTGPIVVQTSPADAAPAATAIKESATAAAKSLGGRAPWWVWVLGVVVVLLVIRGLAYLRRRDRES